MTLFRERRALSLASIYESQGIPVRSTTGPPPVTAETAMGVSTVWGCVRLLADVVAGLPVDVYRRSPGGPPVEVLPAPQVVASPSGLVSQMTWRYQLMVSMLLRGNAYGLVVARDRAGGLLYPTQVELVHPDSVTVRQSSQLSPATYRVGRTDVDPADIVHVSAYNTPGSVVGLAPLHYARQTIGSGLAADAYAGQFWSGGGHPTAVLSTAQPVDQAVATAVKTRFKEATASDHLAVLGAGLAYTAVQVSPDDAGWLESIRATDIQICRFFGVPAEMMNIGVEGTSLTYSNREQRLQDFLAFTVQFWLTRIEEAWTGLLPAGLYVRHNVNAMLRPDTKTRAEVAAIRLSNGITNPDYERELEDLPPIPGGKGQSYVWPPAGAAKPSTGAAP